MRREAEPATEDLFVPDRFEQFAKRTSEFSRPGFAVDVPVPSFMLY